MKEFCGESIRAQRLTLWNLLNGCFHLVHCNWPHERYVLIFIDELWYVSCYIIDGRLLILDRLGEYILEVIDKFCLDVLMLG